MKTGYLAIYAKDGKYFAPDNVKSTAECARNRAPLEADVDGELVTVAEIELP